VKRVIFLAAMSLVGGFSLTGPAAAQAETPTDINADFLTACLGAYGEDSNEFCTCKTEQAKLLENEEMMRYFIAFYQDPNKFREDVTAGNVPQDIRDGWPRFVMESNKVCLQPVE
jgi:hypothetical protein